MRVRRAFMAAAIICAAAQGAPAHAQTDRIVASKPSISPSAPTLPANILRFYVEFAHPAEARFRRSDVRLLDDDGSVVPDLFMDFGQELWSPDGRRLTLLVDPARIKRGVSAQLNEGVALTVGKTYRLSVEGSYGSTEYSFEVTDPVRTPLDVWAWRITLPSPGTRETLIIGFDRLMDGPIVGDAIKIAGSNGPIGGVVEHTNDGRDWRFTPGEPWQAGTYAIRFAAELEDVSGNRLDEALDHDVTDTKLPSAKIIRFSLARDFLDIDADRP